MSFWENIFLQIYLFLLKICAVILNIWVSQAESSLSITNPRPPLLQTCHNWGWWWHIRYLFDIIVTMWMIEKITTTTMNFDFPTWVRLSSFPWTRPMSSTCEGCPAPPWSRWRWWWGWQWFCRRWCTRTLLEPGHCLWQRQCGTRSRTDTSRNSLAPGFGEIFNLGFGRESSQSTENRLSGKD